MTNSNSPALPIRSLDYTVIFARQMPVAPGEVAPCADTLSARGVHIISGPTDQPWGHRTLFFRVNDTTTTEIYTEI